jgi:hypothetical protein
MTGSLVVAIIVIVGFALSITFALKVTESSDPGTGSSASSSSSVLSGAEAQAAKLTIAGNCQGPGASSAQCACIADQAMAAGYDSVQELGALWPQLEPAIRTGNASTLPAPLAAAYQSCFS